jgi:hypothetical protein
MKPVNLLKAGQRLNTSVVRALDGLAATLVAKIDFRYTKTDFGITVGLTPYRGALKP